jgi:hypothetical protein
MVNRMGDIDGLDIRTGKELAEAEAGKKRRMPSFEEYKSTLEFKTPKEILEEEKAWFDKTVNELKWLNQAKKNLLLPTDYQSISGKSFIKKSGVKKLALAFGISTMILEHIPFEKKWSNDIEIIQVTRTKNGKSEIVNVKATGKGTETGWSVRARAIRKDGVFCEALAICTNYELASKKFQDYNEQNILGTAETRATDRSIMNLLGGEVTFEEVLFDDKED